jgi:hypothetical protein
MKKTILIIAVFMTSLAVNAQNTAQNPPKKEKTEYSFVFLWGLFKSDGFGKEETTTLEIKEPKSLNSVSDWPQDTTKYEKKSILWGAIQWSEKKKGSSPVNPQSDEK